MKSNDRTARGAMSRARHTEHRPLFDHRDIMGIVGSRFFERGYDYYKHGMVLSVGLEGDRKIHGEVAGSRSEPYVVDITVDFRADESLFSIMGTCSCPVGFNCKHVVAVLLAANDLSLNREHANEEVVSDPVSPEIRHWLDCCPENSDMANGEIAPTETRDAPEAGKFHIFYVIDRNCAFGMRITPYHGYLKKDGLIGKNYNQLSIFDPLMGKQYATVQDAVIFAKLAFYSDLMYERRSRDTHFNRSRVGELTSLIREIMDTGRARLDQPTGMALSWGPQRNCELQWEVDSFGEQRLATRVDDGSDLSLLRLPVLLYVDPDTCQIGIAKTQLEPRMASWLIKAPPVSQEAIETVSLELSRVGQQTRLPGLVNIKERATEAEPEPALFLYGFEKADQPYTYRFSWGDAAGEIYGNPANGTTTAIFPCIRLEIAYADANRRLRPNEPGGLFDPDNTRKVFIKRNHAREQEFMQTLRQTIEQHSTIFSQDWDYYRNYSNIECNADFILPPYQGPEDSDSVDAGVEFVSSVVPVLKSAGWHIEIDKTWPFHVREGPVEFSASTVSSDPDWFSLALSARVDNLTLDVTSLVAHIVDTLPLDPFGQIVDGFDIDRHLQDFSFYSQLEDGTWLALEAALFARFAEAFLETQGLFGFHRAEAGRLSRLATALEGCGAPWTGGHEIRRLGAKFQALTESAQIEAPRGLTGRLRPYQSIGYGWLRALSDTGFGGALADDMGLGKTVQTLALLAHRHVENKSDHPSLLIAPTSLIGNWRREAARFVPDLKVLVLHGPDRREHFADIPDHDLVITTYPLVNRDHKELFSHTYDIAALDEAQAVKNPAASTTKRIREIRARQRLALTGTPIENNLQELWALYDWLIPGLLGTRKRFNNVYRNPIEKQGDHAKQRLLSTRIKPFLLRRTKEQVAMELPEKTVIDDFILLEGEQAALYESIRIAMDDRVRDVIERKGLTASRIEILDALLKLRQVCCDPRLVKLNVACKVKQSAKLARLMVLLEELVAEGRKVLIFSQFVEMLRLIENGVKSKGWSYSMLHGGTKNRDARIDQFQNENIPLFLISLKAGGLGLNLTAADTVIIYDPWWNPAVERQAMDRAHRIGQDKPVFVHRLIAENTVEAAIQKMQQHKQALADALFEGTGKGPMALTEENIATLFKPGCA